MHLVSGYGWGYSIPKRIASGIRSRCLGDIPYGKGADTHWWCCADADVCCWGTDNFKPLVFREFQAGVDNLI
jgi:hypothetical protein